jgi:ADP-ribosylglycohydrolase
LKPWPDRVIEGAKKKIESESNGSLMRITSLAVWAHKIESMDEFCNAIKLEVSLSHANPIVQDAAICYCLAIRFAIKKECSRLEAFNRVRDWAL